MVTNPEYRGKVKRTPNSLSADKNRKQRNCVAQKAYRARQTLYIKELETKLESVSVPETERNSRLEERNKLYRDRLLESYKKLESMRISLQGILESVGAVLNIRQLNDKEPWDIRDKEHMTHGSAESNTELQSPESAITNLSMQATPQPCRPSHHGGDDDDDDDAAAAKCLSTDYYFPEAEVPNLALDDMIIYQDGITTQTTSGTPSLICEEVERETCSLAATRRNNLRSSSTTRNVTAGPNEHSLFCSYLPFEMSRVGIGGYQDIIERGVIIPAEGELIFQTTNSPFSDHIRALEQLLRQKFQPSGALGNSRTNDSLQNAVSFMISTFTHLSWQAMTMFMAYTKSHVCVSNITAFNICPDALSYSKLDPYYRPTQLQILTPHPVVIDWVPFPSVRDRLIIFHASNPRLDEIVCDIANAYACDIDLSRLIQGFQSTIGYVRVLDLLRSISQGAGRANRDVLDVTSNDDSLGHINSFLSNHDTANLAPTQGCFRNVSSSCELDDVTAASGCGLPAPSITALFKSKTLAHQAFHMLGMDKGPGNLRLDPNFFERYPELYDSKTDLFARGIPIMAPITHSTTLSGPRGLDSTILSKYRELTTWNL